MSETTDRYMTTLDEMRMGYAAVLNIAVRAVHISRLFQEWTAAIDSPLSPETRSEESISQEIVNLANADWLQSAEAQKVMMDFRAAMTKAKRIWNEIPPSQQRYLPTPENGLFRQGT